MFDCRFAQQVLLHLVVVVEAGDGPFANTNHRHSLRCCCLSSLPSVPPFLQQGKTNSIGFSRVPPPSLVDGWLYSDWCDVMKEMRRSSCFVYEMGNSLDFLWFSTKTNKTNWNETKLNRRRRVFNFHLLSVSHSVCGASQIFLSGPVANGEPRGNWLKKRSKKLLLLRFSSSSSGLGRRSAPIRLGGEGRRSGVTGYLWPSVAE